MSLTRKYRWTSCYIAFVVTLILVLEIVRLFH